MNESETPTNAFTILKDYWPVIGGFITAVVLVVQMQTAVEGIGVLERRMDQFESLFKQDALWKQRTEINLERDIDSLQKRILLLEQQSKTPSKLYWTREQQAIWSSRLRKENPNINAPLIEEIK